MTRSTLARRLIAGALLSALFAGPALAAGQAVTLYDQRDNALGTATNPLVTAPSAAGTPQPVTSPDAISTGTIAAGTVGSSFLVAVNDRGTVRFTVTGLSVTGATLQAQYTGADGTTWEPIAALRPPLAYGTTITADGQYEVKASGASAVRLIVTAAGSAGTVAVSALATQLQGLVGLVGALPPGTNAIGSVAATLSGTGSSAADGRPTSTSLAQVQAFPMVYNGTSWDRATGAGGIPYAAVVIGGGPASLGVGSSAGNFNTQRVVLSTDSGLGATAASGGVSILSRIPSSAATTNLTQAKASAGRVYKIVFCNTTTTPARIKFYDALSVNVTVGTTAVKFTRPIPAAAAAGGLACTSWDVADIGWSFATGISYAITAGANDGDTTAVAAGAITDVSVEGQ